MNVCKFVGLILLLSTTVAQAGPLVACQNSRDRDSTYWSWREIDGKKCWYRGRPGKSKSELRWGGAVPLTPQENAVPPPTAMVVRPEVKDSSKPPSNLGSASPILAPALTAEQLVAVGRNRDITEIKEQPAPVVAVIQRPPLINWSWLWALLVPIGYISWRYLRWYERPWWKS
jgi:hypothetical protein